LGGCAASAVGRAGPFVRTSEPVREARVEVEEYPWARVHVRGAPHPHSFVRTSAERRLTTVTCDGEAATAVSGLANLVVLRSAGSEFRGFARDRYTTLEETHD